MAILVDWVKQAVSGTPGTGTITLGSAISGFIRFQDDTRLTNGATVYYTIEDGTNRERGIGTYTASGTTLARTVIHAKIESGTYSENPGTGLSLTSSAIVSCSAIAATHNFRGCLLYHSTTQSTTTATNNLCQFDSEVYDTDGFHSTVTNNTRITIPAGVNLIKLSGGVRFAANATGERAAYIFKNGANLTPTGPQTRFTAASSIAHAVPVSPVVIPCVAGDYFELASYQSSGGNLNVSFNASGHYFAAEVIE